MAYLLNASSFIANIFVPAFDLSTFVDLARNKSSYDRPQQLQSNRCCLRRTLIVWWLNRSVFGDCFCDSCRSGGQNRPHSVYTSRKLWWPNFDSTSLVLRRAHISHALSLAPLFALIFNGLDCWHPFLWAQRFRFLKINTACAGSRARRAYFSHAKREILLFPFWPENLVLSIGRPL